MTLFFFSNTLLHVLAVNTVDTYVINILKKVELRITALVITCYDT